MGRSSQLLLLVIRLMQEKSGPESPPDKNGAHMAKFPFKTALGAAVVLGLSQTFCSFMTPWIALLFLAWVLAGSKLA